MLYKIITSNGWVNYARFCGNTLESYATGERAEHWVERDCNRIAHGLKRLGIRFSIQKITPEEKQIKENLVMCENCGSETHHSSDCIYSRR